MILDIFSRHTKQLGVTDLQYMTYASRADRFIWSKSMENARNIPASIQKSRRLKQRTNGRVVYFHNWLAKENRRRCRVCPIFPWHPLSSLKETRSQLDRGINSECRWTGRQTDGWKEGQGDFHWLLTIAALWLHHGCPSLSLIAQAVPVAEIWRLRSQHTFSGRATRS